MNTVITIWINGEVKAPTLADLVENPPVASVPKVCVKASKRLIPPAKSKEVSMNVKRK